MWLLQDGLIHEGVTTALLVWQPNAKFSPNLKISDKLFISADYSSLGCTVLPVVKFPVSHSVTQSPAGHIVSRGNTVHFSTFLRLPWDMVVSPGVITEIFRNGWLPHNCRDMMSPVGICVTPWDMGYFTTGSKILILGPMDK